MEKRTHAAVHDEQVADDGRVRQRQSARRGVRVQLAGQVVAVGLQRLPAVRRHIVTEQVVRGLSRILTS